MCQEYGHVAANCLTPVKIALINGEPEVVLESESEEFIFRGDEESDMDDDTTYDTLVLTAFNQRCRFIYPSSGVPYLNPRRKMTGDEPPSFISL